MASNNGCFEGAAMFAFDPAPEKILPPEVFRQPVSKDLFEAVTARLNPPPCKTCSASEVMKNPGIVCTLYSGVAC